MAGWNVFCDPGTGVENVVRADVGAPVGSLTGNCSAILGGDTSVISNVNQGDLSVILMGLNNAVNTFAMGVNGMYNTIGNGDSNRAGGFYDTVLNGNTNTVCGCFDDIINGFGNNINTFPLSGNDSCYNSIINGCQNLSCGNFNSIGNGFANSISGYCSFVGSGECNIINSAPGFISAWDNIGGGLCNNILPGSCYSNISGGWQNSVHGNAGHVGGGCLNFSAGDFSAVSGGLHNIAGGIADFIGGGDTNRIINNPFPPNCSSITGGWCNTIGDPFGSIPSDMSHISGGFFNTVQAIGSFIGGGMTNMVCSTRSFIGGGNNHFIGKCGMANAIVSGGFNQIASGPTPNDTCYSLIGGGLSNFVAQGACYTTVLGGQNNCVCGAHLIISGGLNNTIGNNIIPGALPALRSFIGGGEGNHIDTDAVNFNAGAVIGGGLQNYIAPLSLDSSVVGGRLNCIYAPNSFVGGGIGNCILTGAFGSVVGGGNLNVVQLNSHSGFVGGGQGNVVGNPAVGSLGAFHGFVGGGLQNIIDASAAFSTESGAIGGGQLNYLSPGSNHSGVFSGCQNSIFAGGACSTISGGFNNCLGSPVPMSMPVSWGFLGGGCCNVIDSSPAAGNNYSVLGGGFRNYIAPGAMSGTIGGGDGNGIFSAAGVIAGGASNMIGGAFSQASAIVGGDANIISPASLNGFIGAGVNNCQFGNRNTLTAGRFNTIGNYVALVPTFPAHCSVLVGGCNNIIDSGAVNTQYANILGGDTNYIGPGTAHTSILGGFGNVANGNGSVILGGAGNNDGGLANAFIAGTGIALGGIVGNPNSLHVNNLWMQPTTYCNFGGVAPAGTFSLGTIYIDTVGYAGGPILRVQV